MAHFYGTVSGSGQTAATRCGHQELFVTAQSFQGDLVIRLVKMDDVDHVWITVRKHEHAATHTLLYSGPIADLLSMEKRAAQMHLLGVQKFMEGSKP
jgi:hypothetical protein